MPETPGLIRRIASTGSTSDDLAARLRGGEAVPEGAWLVADRQSAGRGRQGRAWNDGAGNFMGSTVVHLAPGDPPPASLALVAGLAIHAAVTRFLPGGQVAQLKWPNDVLVGGAKLAGVLLERVGEAVVVGIGVNIAVAPAVPGRATAALAALGATVSRDGFAEVLAGLFARDVERWRGFGLDPVRRRWLVAGHPEGTPLETLSAGGERICGRFAGLADDGALQLRLADGTTLTLHAGEVFFAES